MSSTKLLATIGGLLEERLGVPVQVVPLGSSDGAVRFTVEGQPRELIVQAKERLSRASLDRLAPPRGAEDGRGWLLVTQQLTPSMRAELRKLQVNYADLAGNVYIREPGLYVMLEGDRKPPRRQPSTARRLNPFSKRASLVLRALLEEPERAWGIREIAGATGLSLGHASEVARELVGREYAHDEQGRISLGNAAAALRDWTDAYDWRKNRVASFVVPFEHDEVGPKLQRAMDAAGVSFALTLLAGADRVAPHVQHGQTHLYVPAGKAVTAADVVREKLYGEPVSTGGTLHLLDPYYRDGVFYGSRTIDAMPVVSPVQLFIDLANYPLRGAEAARMVALGPLASQLGMGRPQVQELTRIAG
jgi:hypothetical protein